MAISTKTFAEARLRWLPASIVCAAMTMVWFPASAAVRVALLDFSTDDNSYRSIQAAADFTSLVQIGLANEPQTEWVERAQIHLAKKEFALAEMKAAGGASPVQRGRMLGADWLVTGHFSSDDREQPTLSFQVIEVEHADVIASDTVVLPEVAGGNNRFGAKQVEIAATSLRRLFADARSNAAQARDQARLAFLFFVDTGANPYARVPEGFSRELLQALERAAITNQHVRLLRFPKAYQATEESEMAVDGIIGAAQDRWRQTADLYAWGKYATTTKFAAGTRDSKLDVELSLWNGVGPPEVVKETLPLGAEDGLSAGQTTDLINRLVARVLAAAKRAEGTQDSAAIRQDIATSILKTYVGMPGRGPVDLSLQAQESFAEAAHMLETACFFDPNNADARFLWITCRYGFGFDLKNAFWSKWRRNQAWKDYVERFGMQPGQGALPSVRRGSEAIPSAFHQSLEEVIALFPQWHSSEEMALEDQWRREGTHTALMSAEYHGFPKEMPHDLAMNWRKELEGELWMRLTKLVEFLKSSDWTLPDKMPSLILSRVVRDILASDQTPSARLALLEGIWPVCAKCAQRFGEQWIVGAGELATDTKGAIVALCAQAGKPEKADELRAMLTQPATPAATDSTPSNATVVRGRQTNAIKPTASSVGIPRESDSAAGKRPAQPATGVSPIPSSVSRDPRMVATPVWMKDPMSLFRMFRLYPPNVLPVEARSEIQVVQFPPRYEVKVIKQMEFRGGQVWILAMDERSAPTSAARPDVSAERLERVSRLWCLDAEGTKPTLFKAEGMPSNINAMLFHRDQLWLAGDSVVALNLQDQATRRFGVADGLMLREVDVLAAAGARLFAAGDLFELSSFDPASAKWTRFPRPMANLSYCAESRYVLTANEQWLGYVAGSALFHNFTRGTWTNLTELGDTICFAPDGERFWAGGERGLRRFDPVRHAIERWNSPVFLESPMIGLVGSGIFMSQANIRSPQLAQAEEQIFGCLRKLEQARYRAHLAKTNHAGPYDPFYLDARIPGRVRALANDGDFLWLGINNYFGSYLLLLHKPSLSLVAGHTMGVRETISSLAVSDQYVWVGTEYGDNTLLRLNKRAFLAVPRSQWSSIAVSAAERARAVLGMSKPDQALYAFYAGDDERVVQLLGDLHPEKAELPEMLMLAWSSDASGVDNPGQCRAWFDRISTRYPDSPWARYAAAAAKTNEVAHEARRVHTLALARFDRNHDGVLNAAERRAMERDAAYAGEEKKLAVQQTAIDMEEIVKRYDHDSDMRLNLEELRFLRQTITVYLDAKQTLGNVLPRKRVLDPLLSKRTPSAEEMLKRYDTDHDGKLSAAELSVLATELQKK